MKKLLLFCFCFIVWACNKSDVPPEKFLVLENIDTTTSPAKDFYKFVNGNWMEKTEIPADEGAWGSFNELRKKSEHDMRAVLEEAQKASQYARGTDQYKALQFYAKGMDTTAIESAGTKPLQPFLTAIDEIEDYSGLQKVVIDIHKKLGAPFFAPAIIQDLKNSQIMAAYLFQSGLGLPSSEYYTDTAQKFVDIRAEYVLHIGKMLQLLGLELEGDTEATEIMALETALAQVSWTPVQLRDIKKMYNPTDLTSLQKSCPLFDWKTYFEELGIKEDTIVVAQPDFFSAMSGIIEKTDLKVLKNYLKWQIIDVAAPYLNNVFVAQNFEFFGKTLNGVPTIRERWRRVLDAVNSGAGFALGKLYVDKYFPPEAKQKASEMVQNIKTAFKTRIENLSWMGDSTKAQALKKLANFKVKIGYPDKWQTYENLKVGETYIDCYMNANVFEFERQVQKLGKPVDPTEWGMTPQTVNAYYHPLYNEIVFPAAILQPPFYNYKADEAINYGGIGAVIGHEITHGFDDKGSTFDANGNLNNWWTENDRGKFKAKAEILVRQFNTYEPLEGLNINGELTLGENIADLGGLTIAYSALQEYFKKTKHPEPIDSYTAEQRFFMSWATIWRIKMRDETLRTRLKTDPHAPGYYRANVPLSNFKPFYEAFGVKEGDGMYRTAEERAAIW